jgi:cation:H+ antiporter
MAQLLDLILIFVFCFLLVKATDILIINFKALCQKTHLRKFALTGLILGLATSLPELFVGLTSAFEGKSILALGNIIGANIANLSLVIGGAALMGGAVKVGGTFLRRDVFYAFLAATSPMLLLSDRVLSRIDGVLLLAFYFLYQLVVFEEHPGSDEKQEDKQERLLRKLNCTPRRQISKEIAWVFFGIALLLFAADSLVKIAVKFAVSFNVPLLLVGLLIISVGTTLPELIFEIETLKKRQSNMAFGNLLGSIVANGTLIIGLAALISPIRIQNLNSYLLSTIAFLIIFGLFYLFIRTKRRLDRWEGLVLLLVYLLFVATEFCGF